MTNQELNEAVARKLGWEVTESVSDPNDKCFTPPGNAMDWGPEPPPYSTSIAAAWEIVDKIFVVKLQKVSDEWQCELNDARGNSAFDASDTAPMAICKTFLKLQEVK